jgi:hypothetical protein
MYKWNHVKAVHLLQELAHVRTGDLRKYHELEINPLNFGFGKAHFVLEKLKQNMILV